MDAVAIQNKFCDMSRKTDKSFKILKNVGEVAYHFPFDEPILCVGCGDGFELDAWKLLGFKDVKGIDVDPEKVAIAKSCGCDAEVASIEDYTFDEKINIYCSHTLEHCKDIDNIFEIFERNFLSVICVIVPIEKQGTKNPSHLSPIFSLYDICWGIQDKKVVRCYENHNYELQGIVVWKV